jgi:hypothetical protein
VKKAQESTNLRARKMMKGKMEPFVVPTMVREMPIEVHVVKQTTSSTTYDISILKIIEGEEVRDTKDDVTTRRIVKGAELGN